MRLLVWNVETFSFNKISPLARANYMSRAVWPAGAAFHADIIAIIEVSAKGRPLGTLVANQGQGGTQLLTHRLNFPYAAPGPWRVVPPLSLTTGGRAEAIAVYYNSNVLAFQGPNNWTAAGSQPGGVPIAYPPPWPVFNGGTQLAGRYAYTTAAGAPITFPTPGHRRPWMVTFQEVGGPRTFEFFFMHTSPHPVANAVAAVANLSTIPEVANPAAANTVKVVAGDFNVDAIFGANYMAAYGALIANGYTALIAQGAAAPPTLLAKRKSARPPVPGVVGPAAPRYWRRLSVDNVLVKDGNAAPAPPVEVYDAVAGAPAPPFPSSMAMTLANLDINYPAPPPPNVARYTVFRSVPNFGHIRGLSDHLALAVDF
jgi:hypothetical protein